MIATHSKRRAPPVLLVAVALQLLACSNPTGLGTEYWFAYVTNRDGDNEIYLVDTGGRVFNLTRHPGSDANPTWSPARGRNAFSWIGGGKKEGYIDTPGGREGV